jgi:hypothetical protein
MFNRGAPPSPESSNRPSLRIGRKGAQPRRVPAFSSARGKLRSALYRFCSISGNPRIALSCARQSGRYAGRAQPKTKVYRRWR